MAGAQLPSDMQPRLQIGELSQSTQRSPGGSQAAQVRRGGGRGSYRWLLMTVIDFCRC